MEPLDLPLFPLADVVLLPRLDVPLYVFEPRYRQLVEHALAGARRIGMVAVLPEHRDAMAGDPPLFEVGCAGLIRQSERRPDGTFEILLAGTGRFRIVDEVRRDDERLYRVARVEAIDGPLDARDEAAASQPRPSAPALPAARVRLLDRLRRLLHEVDADATLSTLQDRFAAMDDEQFVNALSLGLDFTVTEKQRLLESAEPSDRYELLCELIDFRRAELQHPGAARSERLH